MNSILQKKKTEKQQVKSLGKTYWIRLFFLLFFTVILTWYSKQEYNNPFRLKDRIQIAGSSSNCYIRFFKESKNKRKNNIYFILPGFSLCESNSFSIKLPQKFTLITTEYIENIDKCIKTPPLNWIILSTSLNKESIFKQPEPWSSPDVFSNISHLNDVHIHFINPFQDTTNGIYVKYKDIDIVIITEIPDQVNMCKESIFKEKFDAAIIYPSCNETIMKIREMLRPQYIIVLPGKEKINGLQVVSNLIQSESKNFSYIIYKDAKNRLYVK